MQSAEVGPVHCLVRDGRDFVQMDGEDVVESRLRMLNGGKGEGVKALCITVSLLLKLRDREERSIN